MSTLEEIEAICKEKFNSNSDQKEVMNYLRTIGCSKAQSVYLIRRIFLLTAREAKTLVHYSPVWEDTKEKSEKFEENIFNFMDEIKKEQ